MFLSFPPPTKMFQFRGLAHFRVTGLLPAGLSHSEILGSILVCKSPRLIAAYHVFLRLQEPMCYHRFAYKIECADRADFGRNPHCTNFILYVHPVEVGVRTPPKRG